MPSEATAGAFMEGGHGWGNLYPGSTTESVVSLLDFGEGGFFGFISDGEAGEVSERRKVGFLAVFGQIFGEFRKIGSHGGLEDGVIWLIGLDDNGGGVEVAAADATDDLSEELERALFGGEIGEGEAGIGLNDADGGEMR